MIRVLWMVKGLGAGGAERLLVSAAAAHDRVRFELEVSYLVPWKDRLVPELEALGVKVHCLGTGSWYDLAWPARLRSLLRRGRYDVVHAHSPLVAGMARLVVRTFRRRDRPRMVTTEHNGWSTFALPTRLLNGLTAGLDDATIAVSEQTRDSMWWPRLRRRTEVVVHGVALDGLRRGAGAREEGRRLLGVSPEDIVALTVANFRAQKAYPDLLAAAAAVVAQGPPVRFFAVGQGPLEAEVRTLCTELGLDGAFTFLGFRDDVPTLLAGADLFVLASIYEGYPVAIMEALAAGLPVAATAVGGVREAVADGVDGLLVPPGDPNALAAAVLRLAGDPGERARMAAAAGERGTRFDIREATGQIEAVYLRLVACRRPSDRSRTRR